MILCGTIPFQASKLQLAAGNRAPRDVSTDAPRGGNDMLRERLRGAAAGAVGTIALDITTHANRANRGRSASNIPAQVADTLTQAVGLELAPDAPNPENGSGKGKQRKAAGATKW